MAAWHGIFSVLPFLFFCGIFSVFFFFLYVTSFLFCSFLLFLRFSLMLHNSKNVNILGDNFVVAITKNNLVNSSSPSLHCTHHARAGHTKNIWYWKHAFPSTNDTYISSTDTNKIYTDCGRSGHIVEVCYSSPPEQKSYNEKNLIVNNTVAGDRRATESDQQQTSETQDFHYTPQQYQALMSLIK